jgi:hypothetical protein
MLVTIRFKDFYLPACCLRMLKLKQSHYTPRRRLRERRYSSYSFLTSALDGGERSASRPGRTLPPGKGHSVPIGQEAGWTPEPVWTQRLEEKSSCICRGSNLDRPVVQSVAKYYTDWGTRLLTDFRGTRIYRARIWKINSEHKITSHFQNDTENKRGVAYFELHNHTSRHKNFFFNAHGGCCCAPPLDATSF